MVTWGIFKNLFKTLYGKIQLLSLSIVSVISIVYDPSLAFIYFGVHYAISDVYSRALLERGKGFFVQRSTYKSFFRFVHFLLLFFTFLVASYHTTEYALGISFLRTMLPPEQVLQSTFVLSFLYFLMIFLSKKWLFKETPWMQVLYGYVLPEVGLILLAIWCYLHRMHWAVFILYHIVFWFILPLLNRMKRESIQKTVKSYILPTVLVFLITYIFIYPGFMEGEFAVPEDFGFKTMSMPFLGYHLDVTTAPVVKLHLQSMSLGIIHIVFSLVLSSLNPRWIRVTMAEDRKDPFAKG